MIDPDLAAVPIWIAIPAALFLILGSTLALIGSFGLLRIRTFYERLHPPTLGTSWGVAGVAIAALLVSTVLTGRVVVHELLIALFATITTPITFMLLGRTVLYRDLAESAPPEAESRPEAGPPANEPTP